MKRIARNLRIRLIYHGAAVLVGAALLVAALSNIPG